MHPKVIYFLPKFNFDSNASKHLKHKINWSLKNVLKKALHNYFNASTFVGSGFILHSLVQLHRNPLKQLLNTFNIHSACLQRFCNFFVFEEIVHHVLNYLSFFSWYNPHFFLSRYFWQRFSSSLFYIRVHLNFLRSYYWVRETAKMTLSLRKLVFFAASLMVNHRTALINRKKPPNPNIVYWFYHHAFLHFSFLFLFFCL